MNYPSAMCHSVIRARQMIFWKMSVWILKLGRKWHLSVWTEQERRHSSSCFYGFMSQPREKSASMESILKNMIMRNIYRFFPWRFRISNCLLFHWTKISHQVGRWIRGVWNRCLRRLGWTNLWRDCRRKSAHFCIRKMERVSHRPAVKHRKWRSQERCIKTHRLSF